MSKLKYLLFNFLKYLLFIFIIFLNLNVYADDFNVSNTITAPNCNGSSCDGGKYRGTEIYNTGIESIYNVNTRYSGRLSRLTFRVPVPSNFENGAGCYAVGDLTYRLTLNMATNDFRNHFASPFISSSSSGTNWATGSVVYVSYKKIYFDFKIPTTNSCIESLYVDIKSTNLSSTYITGDNNWNLSNITLTAFFPTSPTPPPVSTTPTPTPQPNNQDIINSANQNTQDIINNQNNNSQNVIDSANQNTQDIIENANQNTDSLNDSINQNGENVVNAINNSFSNLCGNKLNVENFAPGTFQNSTDTVVGTTSSEIYGFNENTGYVSWNSYSDWAGIRTRDKIRVISNTRYYVSFNLEGLDFSDIGFFIIKVNYYNYLGGFQTQDLKGIYTNNEQIYFDVPWNTLFVRVSIETQHPHANILISHMYFSPSGNYCVYGSSTSKLDETNAIAKDTNDYLKDNSDPNMPDSDLLNVVNSVGYTDPLNYLLQLPTLLINQLVLQSSTCQVVNLGSLWGVNLTLPCIDIGSYIGTNVWNTIDILFAIGLLVNIFRNLYHTFSNLLTLGAEKEAREKFSMPTPMDFLASILGGGK